ncbi:hypothetical protein I7I53_05980 [Histoplasma capsulatum var. duboisii H88]|uniref:Uncharacterized protein n=1 Tax=Ajellomyces capsulatus (strain H88) TaxID=544711 RepID=A0A8A1L8U2_AJEC8|nr:hypothetical protein I7I53_05980 [Histoplasma capsulatum var. duboisii H88]
MGALNRSAYDTLYTLFGGLCLRKKARNLISVLLYLEIPIFALLPRISVIASNQSANRDSGAENQERISQP